MDDQGTPNTDDTNVNAGAPVPSNDQPVVDPGVSQPVAPAADDGTIPSAPAPVEGDDSEGDSAVPSEGGEQPTDQPPASV